MDPHHSQIRESEKERERKNEVIPSERNVIVIAGQFVVEKEKLSVPATQPRLFPFKLLLADEGEERGKDRGWDRELSAVSCPGTRIPAFISSDSAASHTVRCMRASAMCSLSFTILICFTLSSRKRFYSSCMFEFYKTSHM